MVSLVFCGIFRVPVDLAYRPLVLDCKLANLAFVGSNYCLEPC